MSMKDKLTPDQMSDINLISTMDRIHDIFIKSFNAALPKLENSQLQRLAYFTAFKRQVWELVFPKADTDKDKLNEKFEEYFDIISKYIVTGGNPTEMVAAATEYIRQLKIHITQFEDLTDIVGNKAFTKLMSNDIKIKFITFIKEYVNDDNFMSDPDPKRSLIQAMKELNQMVKNDLIDIKWLNEICDKVFSLEDKDKRIAYLTSQEITLKNKGDIRTVQDVAEMGIHIDRLKTVLMDESLPEDTKEAFTKFAIRDILDNEGFPAEFKLDVVRITEPLSRDDKSGVNVNEMVEKLDELVEKYTPDNKTLRKNTLLNDLMEGTVKLVVDDDKCEDELNW